VTIIVETGSAPLTRRFKTIATTDAELVTVRMPSAV